MLHFAITSGHSSSYASAIQIGKRLRLFGPVRGETFNLHPVQYEKAQDRAKRLLTQLIETFDHDTTFDDDCPCVLSLPGVFSSYDVRAGEQLLDDLRFLHCPRSVIDDTWSGLVAGLSTQTFQTNGICAFAGTGASVFICCNQQTVRPYKRDGYGPLLGDFGSGFRLAMNVLEQFVRSETHGTPVNATQRLFIETVLLDEIVSDVTISGFPFSTDVTHWFHALQRDKPHDWRTHVAKLASKITQIADFDTPDSQMSAVVPICQALVDRSATEMAATIATGIKELENEIPPGCINITCQGGMFRHSKRYFNSVLRLLRDAKLGREINMKRAAYHPHVGAQLIATTTNYKTIPDPDRIRAICACFQNIHDDHLRATMFFGDHYE